MSSNPVPAILAGLLILVTLFYGTTFLSEMGEDQSGIGERVKYDAAELNGTQWATLNDGRGTDEIAYETTGFAVNLSGADDSYVQSKSGFEIASDKTWTVSAWGYVEQGNAGQNLSMVSANGRVIITYNGSQSQWQVWYYEEGDRDSHQVNVSTSGNEVGNYTNVMAWANGTHLSVYRNNTQGEVLNLSTDEITNAPVDAKNWDGRLEEIRTFDDALNTSERNTLINNPAEEFIGHNVTSRAMFDQPNKSVQLLLYTNTELEQSNVGFSSGFPEQRLTDGTDYKWRVDGPQIQAVASGDIDGAPVVYAEYRYGTELATVNEDWSTFTGIVSYVPLFIIGIAILFVVARLQ